MKVKAKLDSATYATDEELEIARDIYARDSDGDIEIDNDAKSSIAEDGVWVQAWVWLSKEES